MYVKPRPRPCASWVWSREGRRRGRQGRRAAEVGRRNRIRGVCLGGKGDEDMGRTIRVGMMMVLAALLLGTGSAWARTVRVDASSRWNDTGVYVHEGDRLVISAWGVAYYTGTESCTPEGRRGKDAPGSFLLPGAPVQGLIARIDGKVFYVGNQFQGYAPASGRLYLGMNEMDCSYCWRDNRGSWTARIQVQR